MGRPAREPRRRRRSAALGLAALFCGAAGEPAGPAAGLGSESVALRFDGSPESPDFGSVSVHGLSANALARLAERPLEAEDWHSILTVHKVAEGAADASLPSVLGSHRIDGNLLRFTPRLLPAPGIVFRARFDGRAFDRLADAGPAPTPDLELTFTPPEPPAAPPTVVESVYPSGLEVPENLLRLYLHFSAPMRARDVARAVRLVDEAGGEVELPFVEIEHGLWDRDNRRLTLFFHPGRVKRGVGPNLALGPPLKQGASYRLVVEPELRDARGHPLAQRFEHAFRAGPADRDSPDPARWQLVAPAAPDEPLVVDFPEPLDRALLLRLLAVRSPQGAPVAGRATVSRHETRWSFRPEEPWQPGVYRLQVHPALEDLAGNRLDRRFDEEPGREAGGAGEPASPLELPFAVALD